MPVPYSKKINLLKELLHKNFGWFFSVIEVHAGIRIWMLVKMETRVHFDMTMVMFQAENGGREPGQQRVLPSRHQRGIRGTLFCGRGANYNTQGKLNQMKKLPLYGAAGAGGGSFPFLQIKI